MKKLIAALTIGTSLVAVPLAPAQAGNPWPLIGGIVGGIIIGGALSHHHDREEYYMDNDGNYYYPTRVCRYQYVYDEYGHFVGERRVCWRR